MKLRNPLVVAAIALAALCLSSRQAAAQEERPSSVGVGVETMLAGPTGPAVIFQTPAFHVEGILAFFDLGDETDLTLAGRFWYAVSQTARSDFSVGGGIGILINDDGDPNNDNDVAIEIDIGAQLRAFIVPNVALSVTLGFSIVADDGPDPIALGGDLLGTTGIAYFF